MENTLLTEIKNPRYYIAKIHVVESNFKYIATTGKINGTLLLEIEKCMELYAKQFQDRAQVDVLITEIMILREKNAELVEMLKKCNEVIKLLDSANSDILNEVSQSSKCPDNRIFVAFNSEIESLINSNITE